MSKIGNVGSVAIVATLFCLLCTSCNKNADQAAGVQEEPGSDPAQANLAAPSGEIPQQAPMQQAQRSYPANTAKAAPAPLVDQNADQNYDENYDQNYSDAAEPAVAVEQPPPPIPQYSQPECPGENYIWTPGSWAYAPAGYYWVPGAWVLAPYVGALWTPPYWAYGGERYHWHHGYWGRHVGFYGGINYGFGYVGRGYEGGYWNRDRFAYNRSVNNVNITIVHNVYNYRVTNITETRVSYVGGRGGLNARPTPAEIAALHEPRIAPVPAQVQHMKQAEASRKQFAEVNQGRPETLVAQRPLATEYKAPAPRVSEVPGARSLPAVQATRVVAAPLPQRPYARPNEPEREHPLPANKPIVEVHPQEHPAPPQPRTEERRAPEPRPEQRPSPEPKVTERVPPPRVEQRPAPPPKMEERRAPEPRPEEHARPEAKAAPRVEQRPAPPPKTEERPATKPGPKPQEKKEEGHEPHP